jgi:hypothetical protein
VADEIKVRVKVTCENGFFKDLFDPGEISVTQTTANGHSPVVDVGTTEEVISFGDVSAANVGYVAFRNLDTTNYVQIGPESAGAMVAAIRLKAGEVAVLRLEPSVTLRAKANTAAVKLQMKLLQT